MTEQIVQEWLTDYNALSPEEVHSFASSVHHNVELVNALYTVLEDRNRFQELIDPVCTQLFGFYRSREVELQRFTLQFLPTLVFVYLNSVAHGDKKSCRSVETLLIGLYNLEVVDENGQPKVVSFRLPSLARHSIYHEPMSLAHASLTESALRRLEECDTKLVSWGPLPQVETLNAQNRLKVMTALLFVYNIQLSLLHKSALEHLCKVSSKLVTQGFNKPGHHQRSSYGSDSSFIPRLLPRIPVSSQFLLEFVNALYFAMFNGFSYVATQTLEDIYYRACYECFAEVVLVTNAIRNSLQVNPSGQPGDGPMGISVALSPATTTVTTVSKSMITNASFRTKKLPDDIEEELVASLSTSQQELEGQRRRQSLIVPVEEESPSPSEGTPEGDKSKAKGSKWRAWSWKHGSNRSSVEEESPPPSSDQNREEQSLLHSSPSHSKNDSKPSSKSNSRRGSEENSAASPKKNAKAQTSFVDGESRSNSNSPKRYQVASNPNFSSPQSCSPSPTRASNRMSAGARLCKVFEESFPEDGSCESNNEEILQTFFIAGRPASVSLLQASGDDIPIQEPKDEASGEAGKNLGSISEEQEEPEKLTPRGSSMRARDLAGKKLPNFPGLGKKVKDGKTGLKNGTSSSLEKKDSLNEGKKMTTSSVAGPSKDGKNVSGARGALLSIVMNGESGSSDIDGSTRKKSMIMGPVEANGPLLPDGAIANGNMGSCDQEKGSVIANDSLATTGDHSGPLDSGSLFTGESVDLSADDSGEKLTESSPLSHKVEVDSRSALQVSTV